jgi:probable rRNA maturation factor
LTTNHCEGRAIARFNIQNRQHFVNVSNQEVLELARECAPPDWRGAEVNIVFANDADVIRLNRQFMRRSGITDVLAFPLADENAPPGNNIIGDVVVNAEHAFEEANVRGVSPREELALYLVHGLLHLAGYDDHGAAKAKAMYEREEEVLRAAGWDYVR